MLALVVALWPSLKLAADEPTISLCNYQQFSVFNYDPAPPDARDKLLLFFQGKSIPVTELSVTHFCLTNQTGRVVERNDFAQPLSFKAIKGVEVIYVKSFRQEPTTALATSWHRSSNNSWEMVPTVLNPDETLWFQLVYRVPESLKDKSATDIFQWQALFKGATFKISNVTEPEVKWYYLQIKHNGLGLYLLIGCGLIFSFASFVIYLRNAIKTDKSPHKLIVLVALSAMSWAVAEMIIDVAYNQNVNQPLIAWVFVIALAAIAIGSVLITKRNSWFRQRDDSKISSN